MKRLLAIILVLLAVNSRATIYNWTNVPNTTAYVAGDTVKLWETFITAFVITNSGTVGNPITFQLQSNCRFVKDCWPNTGAIQINARSNIVIDGGIIMNTNNGTGLALSNSTAGIAGSPSGEAIGEYLVIKNVTITNLYLRTAHSSDGQREGYPIVLVGQNLSVSNCVLSDGDAMITYSGASVLQSNITFANNTLIEFNHGFNIGVGDTNAEIRNIVVSGNFIEARQRWDQVPGDNLHTDGMIVLNNGYDPSSLINGFYIFNNWFGSNFGTFTTAAIFLDLVAAQKQLQNCFIWNNFFAAGANNWGNGFISGAGSNIWAFNNTMIGSSGNGFGGTNAFWYNNLMTAGSVGFFSMAFGSYTTMTNNVHDDTDSGVYLGTQYALSNYFSGLWSDYNTYGTPLCSFGLRLWNGSGQVAGGYFYNTGDINSLTNWQTFYLNNRCLPWSFGASNIFCTNVVGVISTWNSIHADPHSNTNTPTFNSGTYIPAIADTVANGKGTNLTVLLIARGFPYSTAALNGSRSTTARWTIGAYNVESSSTGIPVLSGNVVITGNASIR